MRLPLVLSFVLFFKLSLFCQEIDISSMEASLEKINKFVSKKEIYKEAFLDRDFLLAKKERTHGAEKVSVLLKLVLAHIYDSKEEVLKYNTEAKELAKQINYKKGYYRAKYFDGFGMLTRGDFDTCLKMLDSLDSEISFKNYPENYADNLTLRSYIYTEKGDYEGSLKICLKLLKQAEKTNNDYLFLKAYAGLRQYYYLQKQYPKSYEYYIKSLDAHIKLKLTYNLLAQIDDLGKLLEQMNYNDEALKVYYFYLKVEKKIKIGGSFLNSNVYKNMAEIYLKKNDIEKAQEYLKSSLDIIYSKGYKFRLPRTLHLQGSVFLKQKDTLKAIQFYEKSFASAEDLNAFDVMKMNSQILLKLYEKRNNVAKSFEYQTLLMAIKDSLSNNEKEQKLEILEAKKKVVEITQKKKLLELQNDAQKSKMNYIIMMLIFIFCVSIFAIYSYLKVKNSNKLLYKKAFELAEMQLNVTDEIEKVTAHKNTAVISKNTAPKTINEDLKEVILFKLDKLEKEHFFLDSNCSLSSLAKKLKTNAKYLSQVINQEKQMNFNNYINDLRINYLLSKLIEDKEFRANKLSYIGATLGYNNLNTFNKAFKKKKGILPSFFISELNKQEEEHYSSI